MMKSRKSSFIFKNKMIQADRKLPINTIVLPPLPPLEDNDFRIFHQVLVNKPKSGNVNAEVMSLAKANENQNCSNENISQSEAPRISQLEQNIRFLQEQHSQMLTGLHKEIDNLRHQNRDLQFQLVFTKGTSPSSPSSPEDDSKPKICLSPKQINVTPLQVEILEKEIGELKLQLEDTDSRNAYLSAIVEEQKRKLERYERDRERELERATQPDPELLRKLDDAENLIRRLRRENSELRRDNFITSTSSSGNSSSSGYHHREGGNYQRGGTAQNRSNGRQRGNSAGHYRGNWFPPLHGQTFWNGGRAADRNGESGDMTTLPSLIPNGGSNNGHYQSRRGANNNQYHNGEGKKYRSGQNRGPKPS